MVLSLVVGRTRAPTSDHPPARGNPRRVTGLMSDCGGFARSTSRPRDPESLHSRGAVKSRGAPLAGVAAPVRLGGSGGLGIPAVLAADPSEALADHPLVPAVGGLVEALSRHLVRQVRLPGRHASGLAVG